MAELVIFNKTVTNDDQFTSLAPSAQALYFHLGMDTDGNSICTRPKAIMRMLGATETDMALLVKDGFIKVIEDGYIEVVGAGGLDDG